MSQAPLPCDAACLPDVSTLLRAPVVGHWYRVPALLIPSTGCWVPVLGRAHADPNLPGGEQEHYHLDLRFVAVSILRSWDPLRLLFDTDEEEVLRDGLRAVLSAEGPPPELRAMQCMREQLVHSARHIRGLVEAIVPPHTCLKDRCPHHGIPRSAMCESVEDGTRVVVCPGHGLRFDAGTGLVRRRPAEATP